MTRQETQILSTVQARIERYDRLVELAREQRALLTGTDHSRLGDIVAESDPLLLQIKQFDDRETALLASSDQGPGAEYTELMEALYERASELRRLTMINRELLAGAKQLADFSIGVICRIATDQAGQSADVNPAIVLDMRV